MARIISWERVPEPLRFVITSYNVEGLWMTVLDRNTRTVYKIEAAGKTEFETMLKMDDARWAAFTRTIEG